MSNASVFVPQSCASGVPWQPRGDSRSSSVLDRSTVALAFTGRWSSFNATAGKSLRRCTKMTDGRTVRKRTVSRASPLSVCVVPSTEQPVLVTAPVAVYVPETLTRYFVTASADAGTARTRAIRIRAERSMPGSLAALRVARIGRFPMAGSPGPD